MKKPVKSTMRDLAARGYRRIGVATTHHLEKEALFELSAGRARFARQNPAHPAFEPCLVDSLDEAGAAKITRWIRKHDVDCIVTRWRQGETCRYSVRKRAGA